MTLYFTMREKIMKQLLLIRHNYKYKLFKGDKGLLGYSNSYVLMWIILFRVACVIISMEA